MLCLDYQLLLSVLSNPGVEPGGHHELCSGPHPGGVPGSLGGEVVSACDVDYGVVGYNVVPVEVNDGQDEENTIDNHEEHDGEMEV